MRPTRCARVSTPRSGEACESERGLRLARGTARLDLAHDERNREREQGSHRDTATFRTDTARKLASTAHSSLFPEEGKGS